jgi:hypothetical protein
LAYKCLRANRFDYIGNDTVDIYKSWEMRNLPQSEEHFYLATRPLIWVAVGASRTNE